MYISSQNMLTRFRYYSSYHTRFPLLQEPMGCIDSYNTCPLLFWTVMELAARNSSTYLYLSPQLQAPVARLAANFSAPASRSIYFVQALLIRCLWPLPYMTVNGDPSCLYCGVAIQMATLIGLHRPQHPYRFLSAMDSELGNLEARIRTWVSCFIVDQVYCIVFYLSKIKLIGYQDKFQVWNALHSQT